MSKDLTVSCQCGAFQAVIHGASPSNGNHGMCYCTDCQAFARHLGQLGVATDALGGTEIYQTQPARVEITAGADKLALLQLRKKGLYRWHTNCCNTPICNTMGQPKLAFAGFLVPNIKATVDVLGPIRFRYKREEALGVVSEPSGSMLMFIFRSLRAIAMERISGRWKKTPFFGEDGRAMVKPYVLSEEELEAAYDR
jgi:hypothetical protein